MILMVYNTQICKEFLLPNVHDADYTIHLRRDIYQLKQDVELKLENSSGGWELLKGEDYQIEADGACRARYLLRHQNIVIISTQAGDRFQIIAVDCTLNFMVMEKYDISSMKEVSVGKSEGSLIRYQFMELVSGSHAVFQRERDGWYLKDTSRNGVFCGNLRLRGSRKLSFGDTIDIFGLHLYSGSWRLLWRPGSAGRYFKAP